MSFENHDLPMLEHVYLHWNIIKIRYL